MITRIRPRERLEIEIENVPETYGESAPNARSTASSMPNRDIGHRRRIAADVSIAGFDDRALAARS
jgi:hypothetical protein